MGKQGPCHHCGVTSTPLWRNGPPEKPVLCNACGSRWRTKGTLVNYAPLHSRLAFDEGRTTHRVFGPRATTFDYCEPTTPTPKRRHTHDDRAAAADVDTLQRFPKAFDEDVNNPSSSGSAVSYAESCVHFTGTDACDFTGPHPSPLWDMAVPSRKRTSAGHLKPPSQFEKLTRDLYTIFQEQPSSFSTLSDDDLLPETDRPMVSVETGHGSILIRQPSSSLFREEESESSSLSVEKRPNHTLTADGEVAGNGREVVKNGRPLVPGSPALQLSSVQLKEIVNFEGPGREEEQIQLSKLLLPSADREGGRGDTG